MLNAISFFGCTVQFQIAAITWRISMYSLIDQYRHFLRLSVPSWNVLSFLVHLIQFTLRWFQEVVATKKFNPLGWAWEHSIRYEFDAWWVGDPLDIDRFK